jgi:hypothetical protein
MKWTASGTGELIFYAGCLAGSVWFLVAAIRNPDRSAKREPFRRPELLLGSGFALFSPDPTSARRRWPGTGGGPP